MNTTLKITAITTLLAGSMLAQSAEARNNHLTEPHPTKIQHSAELPAGATYSNVLEEIDNEPELNNFRNAIILSGVDKELVGKDLTVFAPRNGAFAEFSAEELKKLQMPENREELAQLVRMHFVEGSFYKQDTPGGVRTLTTLAGDHIKVKELGRRYYVGDSEILSTEMHADGILYEIDGLIVNPDTVELAEATKPQQVRQDVYIHVPEGSRLVSVDVHK